MNGVQTRLNLQPDEAALLREVMSVWNRAVRQTYQRMQTGRLDSKDLQSINLGLQHDHGLTSHQAASVWARVEQVRSMDQETARWLRGEAEARVQKSQARVAQAEQDLKQALQPARSPFAKPKCIQQLRTALFQAKRALEKQESRLNNVRQALATGHYHRVFGSKKLLRQRSQLDRPDSPWADEAAWRAEWARKREGELWFSGDGGAVFGNKSIKWDPEAGTVALRLTAPQAQRRLESEALRLGVPVEKVPGKMAFKRLVLTDVELSPHFKAQLLRAQAFKLPITIQIQRKPVPKSRRQRERLDQAIRAVYRGPGRKRKPKQNAQTPPVRRYATERARAQAKQAQLQNRDTAACALKTAAQPAEFAYYLHASFDLPKAPLVTSRMQGVLGVDLNAWGLAWCVATPDGNVAKDGNGRPLKGNLALELKGLTSPQAKTQVQAAVNTLVDLAVTHRVALAHEALDFQRAKQTMKAKGAGYARMLSGLRTAGFEAALRSRAGKHGIPIHAVDPAWTSLAGFAKYGLRNALSVDQAAAFAVARKALLGKEPASFARAIPTHAAATGKKLSPKFRRSLQARRDDYVLKYEEAVRFAQPVPCSLQWKRPGPTVLSWQNVQKALGSDRRSWVKTLTDPLPDVEPTPASPSKG